MNIENNLIGLKNLQTPIYRIFSLDRFHELIKNNENVLVNPSKWDDPFENFFLKNPAIMPDGTPVSLSQLSNNWYGQCWTLNKDSDAMWRIYSNEKTGVRIKTTIKDLFSIFYDSTDKFATLKYLIGLVEYKSQQDIEYFLANTSFNDLADGGQPHNFAKTLLIKRFEFSHENEVRLLFYDSEGNHGQNGIAQFNFPWAKIISEIALDPRLDENNYKSEKKRLVALGCTAPILQSELYKFTPTEIRIQ